MTRHDIPALRLPPLPRPRVLRLKPWRVRLPPAPRPRRVPVWLDGVPARDLPAVRVWLLGGRPWRLGVYRIGIGGHFGLTDVVAELRERVGPPLLDETTGRRAMWSDPREQLLEAW